MPGGIGPIIRVRCINDDGCRGDLKNGEEYDVQVSKDFPQVSYNFAGNNWHKKRFEVVVSEDTPIYVKCIDDNGREEFISKGHVYEVVKENSTNYFLKGETDPAVCHMKSRFEIITRAQMGLGQKETKPAFDAEAAVDKVVSSVEQAKKFDWATYTTKLPGSNQYQRRAVDPYTGLPIKE